MNNTNTVTFVRRQQDTDYYRVPQFGEDSHFDAAHVTDDQGHVVAVFIEPESRKNRDGSFDDDAFRTAVLAEVNTWDSDCWAWVQFDPGRDQCTEVRNPVKS